MADPYAALKAKYGIGETAPADDPYADLKAKYGIAAPVEAAPSVPGLDMGPEARRARGGGFPRPRELTAEEAGVMSGPLKTKVFQMGPIGNMETYRPIMEREAESPQEKLARPDRDAQERGEFAQLLGAGALGGVAGKAALGFAAPLLGRAAPYVAPIFAGGVEGGTFNKALGGDFLPGAAFGAAVPALTGGAEAIGAGLAKGAPARVEARVLKNLGEDVKKSTADKVTAVAKRGDLAEVVERNPELRKPLAIQAKEDPAKALKVVQATKRTANAARDADFETMQQHFSDKPPSSQATIAGLLDDTDALLKTNLGDRERQAVLKAARKEIAELGDDLRKVQGLPPAVGGDYSGTIVPPKDLRALEQTIGSRAYEGIPIQNQMSVKRRVNAELYKPLARQMNQLAENTPGVDAKKFAATGKDIHVLIPVEEALTIKADRASQGKMTPKEILTHAMHAATHVAGLGGGFAAHGVKGAIVGTALPAIGRGAYRLAEKAGRRLDYDLAAGVAAPRLREPFSGTQPIVLAGDSRDRGYAGTVLDGLKNGQTLQEAVAAAGD